MVLLCTIFGPVPAGTRVAGVPCPSVLKRALGRFLQENLDLSRKTLELRAPKNHPFGGTMKMPLGGASGFGISPDPVRTVAAMGLLYGPFSRPRDFPLFLKVDEETWARGMEMVSRFFEVRPVEARWEILPGDRVVVVPDRPGLVLDEGEFERRLLGELRWERIPQHMEVPMVEVKASLTYEKLKAAGVDGVIASFSTFYQDNCDRAHNVELAAKELDGAVVWPGEIFSFNERVGPRIPERGYRKAPVYVGTRLEDDYGGGVCQVSSTLYAALLRAGLEVVERHNHGMPVDYLRMGEDATVVYGLLDLKMRNVLDAPVIVKARAEGGTLTVTLFGRRHPVREIVVETYVEKELGGDEPGGKKWVVRTKRLFLSAGKLERVEDLGTSVYTSLPREHTTSTF